LLVLVLIEDRTGRTGFAALVVGMMGAVAGLVAPLQGAWIDRKGMSQPLLLCGGAHALSLIGFGFAVFGGASDVVTIALAVVGGASIPPVSVCTRAILAVTVRRAGVRESGYAVDAVLTQLTFVLGPLTVAGAFVVGGAFGGVVVLATITCLGTWVFATLGATRDWISPSRCRDRARRSHRVRIELIIGCVLVTDIGWGAIMLVGLPATAFAHESASAAGLLVASCGVGAVFAGLAMLVPAVDRFIPRTVVATLIGAAILTLPLAATWSIVSAAVFAFVAGASVVPITVAVSRSLGGEEGRIGTALDFSWMTVAMHAGMAAGALLASPVLEIAGPDAVLRMASGCAVTAAVLSVAFRRRIG
jgi:hypothetical protein